MQTWAATVSRNIPNCATLVQLLQEKPVCDHSYWTASCPECARKALRLAILLKTKYEPVPQIDPNESPLAAFRRREADAKKQLGVGQ
jgi:hypothetical protein